MPGLLPQAAIGCILRISPAEVSFSRRGFNTASATAQIHLERVGKAFLAGYHCALNVHQPAQLATQLNLEEPTLRGFAFEGAAAALAILDHTFHYGRQHWCSFLEGPGARHRYMLHVGYGWAVARLPWLRWKLDQLLSNLDELLRWLVIDGFGFHEGYFDWQRAVVMHKVPRQLHGYARRAFDQGIGRSLWFVACADPKRIRRLVSGFDLTRQSDLWSGVGLACAYAGGVDPATIRELQSLSNPFECPVAQGAAFAAKARQLAGNASEDTDAACEILCGMSADDAANETDVGLLAVAHEPEAVRFERWRRWIRLRMAKALTVRCDM